MAELIDQYLNWNPVLQGNRKCRTEAIHDTANGGSLFSHGDKDLTRSSIGIKPNAEVTFMSSDREFVSNTLPSVM